MMENGDFLVIGTDAKEAFKDQLPIDASCADYESIVMIPHQTFKSAASSFREFSAPFSD